MTKPTINLPPVTLPDVLNMIFATMLGAGMAAVVAYIQAVERTAPMALDVKLLAANNIFRVMHAQIAAMPYAAEFERYINETLPSAVADLHHILNPTSGN